MPLWKFALSENLSSIIYQFSSLISLNMYMGIFSIIVLSCSETPRITLCLVNMSAQWLVWLNIIEKIAWLKTYGHNYYARKQSYNICNLWVASSIYLYIFNRICPNYFITFTNSGLVIWPNYEVSNDTIKWVIWQVCCEDWKLLLMKDLGNVTHGCSICKKIAILSDILLRTYPYNIPCR